MTFLQLLWFFLIGVLFSGYFFLEGFDYGVGILHLILGRDQEERDQIMMTIDPVWDGNQVWLLTAGGAIFASYPMWYATLFSGFYIPLFLVLAGLIFRGVCFAFRHFSESKKAKKVWDYVFGISNIIPPFVLGMVFTAMVSGIPLAKDGNIYAGVFDYITPFSLVGGVAVLVLCLVHGLNYLVIKTDGDVKKRALLWSKYIYPVLLAGEVVFAVSLFFYTDFFQTKLIATLIILALIVVSTVASYLMVFANRHFVAFLLSGLTFVLIVVLLFVGVFPRLVVSSISANYSLLIVNASSSQHTLTIMTIVAVCILPFVLAYQAWALYFFSKPVSKNEGGHY